MHGMVTISRGHNGDDGERGGGRCEKQLSRGYLIFASVNRTCCLTAPHQPLRQSI